MPTFRHQAYLFSTIFLAVSVFGFGCSDKQMKPAKSIPPEQVAPTLQSAFNGADSSVKEAADGVVSAMQNQDTPRALSELQVLSSRPDLSDAQRTAAAQSTLSVLAQLHADAANGKKEAQEALQRYQATR